MKKIVLCAFVLAGCTQGTVQETIMLEKDTVEVKYSDEKITSGYYYEPSVTVLSGQILKETFWGPPGFGEDTLIDSKEVCDVLIIDKPVDINADTTSDFNVVQTGVDRFQLLTHTDFNQFNGTKVEVSGKLFGAQTGHHHTQVLMDVIDVKELK